MGQPLDVFGVQAGPGVNALVRPGGGSVRYWAPGIVRCGEGVLSGRALRVSVDLDGSIQHFPSEFPFMVLQSVSLNPGVETVAEIEPEFIGGLRLGLSDGPGRGESRTRSNCVYLAKSLKTKQPLSCPTTRVGPFIP